MKQDFGTVVSCAEEALSILKSVAPLKEGMTMMSTHAFCLCWKKDLSVCINAFEYAYQSSMRVGDVEPAMWMLSFSQVCTLYQIRVCVDSIETLQLIVNRFGSRLYWVRHWQGFWKLFLGLSRTLMNTTNMRPHCQSKCFGKLYSI